MGKITEQNKWEETIYAVDTGDPVLGGAPEFVGNVPVTGHANAAPLQLANRTQFLKKGVEDAIELATQAMNSPITGVYTVTLIEELNAITPPGGTNPGGRVTEGPGAGYYVWKNNAWVKTTDPLTDFDSLTINKGRDYPMKVVDRGATAPQDVHPTWRAALLGARFEYTTPGLVYRISYYGNGVTISDSKNYGLTIYSMPENDLTNQTLIVGYGTSEPMQFDRELGGIQVKSIMAGEMRVTLVVDVDQLPADGQNINSSATTHNGYNSIISPDCYFIKGVDSNDLNDSLSLNIGKDFPFLEVARGGTAPQNVSAQFKNVIAASSVRGARIGYSYRIGYYGNGVETDVEGVTAKRYGFSVYRIRNDRMAEGYQEIINTFATGPQFIPDRVKGGIQTFEFACETEPNTRINLAINVDNLPADGTQLNSSAATHNGFNSIIHPINYEFEKFNEFIEGDCLVDWDAVSGKLIFAYKSKGRWFNERFQRKSINQTFTMLGFGFDAAYAAVLNNILPVDSIALTSRTEASSDFIAPMTFRITSGTPDAGTTAMYTGGSHGTNNAAGDPTSEMKLCNIYVDGVILDQTKSIRKICKFVDILTQQDVQAWNTTVSKRPALEEYVSFNLSPKGVQVYKRAKALFDLEFTADNACQVYLAGMTPVTVDSYLFWGGNQTSRRTMTGTTAFDSGSKAQFPDCYGVSVRHASTNVEFSAWVDPYFGHGDRRALSPTEPYFKADADNGKIYPRLATPSSPFTLKAGEWYEWRGGYYHGDYTDTENFDTVIQTQDGVIAVKPTGKYEVRNEMATVREYVKSVSQEIVDGAVATANQYTNNAISNLLTKEDEIIVGRPVDPINGSNIPAGTYIYFNPLSTSGYVSEIKAWCSTAGEMLLKLYERVSNHWEIVQSYPINLDVGLNTITLPESVFPVSQGQHLSFSCPLGVVDFTGNPNDEGGHYVFTSQNVTTSSSLGSYNSTARLQFQATILGTIPIDIGEEFNRVDTEIDAANAQIDEINEVIGNIPVAKPLLNTDGRTLTRFRAKRSTLKILETGNPTILMTGDSWTEHATIPRQMRALLEERTGLPVAAYGWIDAVGGSPMSGLGYSNTGWTKYNTATGGTVPSFGTGPDGRVISTLLDTATCTIITKGTKFTIYYLDGTGTFRYRAGTGGEWVTVAGENTGDRKKVVIDGMEDISRTISIDTQGNTGEVVIYGYLSESSGAGPVLHKAGCGGSTGTTMLKHLDYLPQYIPDLAPDVVVIILGTNDYRNAASVTFENYTAAITSLITKFRAAVPDVGIVLWAPAQTNGVAQRPLTDYVNEMKRLSEQFDVEFFNQYEYFGPYAESNALGQWKDSLHMDDSGAYNAASVAFRKLLY